MPSSADRLSPDAGLSYFAATGVALLPVASLTPASFIDKMRGLVTVSGAEPVAREVRRPSPAAFSYHALI